MWVLSDVEVVKLQNRINDLWEVPTRPKCHGEYVAAANRLIGTLDSLFSANHYFKEKKDE